MASFVLDNGSFLLNDGSGRLLRGSLRVENGKIAKIARSIPKLKGEKRIDLAGQTVIPGFVQTHVHLCQTLFRNFADDLELLDWLRERIWPFEGAHNEKSLYASARLGIAELLAGGTTTILDMGTVRHTDAIFEAAKSMGIRAFIGKCLMDRDDNPPT
ncbi:MAG: amidohydrolase family protein, partial [Bdellovibrionota bacterium]